MEQRKKERDNQMNAAVKMSLIILASALVAGGGVATTTHDLWTISVAVLVNIGTTLGGLLIQSPLPRKEWTDEQRAEKVVPAVPPVVKPA
jgi:hypothetical protein